KGGGPLECTVNEPCSVGICDESTRACRFEAARDGATCEIPGNLCVAIAQCRAGTCVPRLKDCSFAPGVDGCHEGICDPSTGDCMAVEANEDGECRLPEDGQCQPHRVCKRGVCQGGNIESVCADMGCFAQTPGQTPHRAVCNPVDGNCVV